MANKAKPFKGQLGSVKNTSGIDNQEHHDLSISRKTIHATPGSIDAITADTAEHATLPGQMVRFTNTAASTAFVWIGEAGSSPGAPAIADSLALPPNSVMTVVMPSLVTDKSPAYKCSAATVQAVTIEQ